VQIVANQFAYKDHKAQLARKDLLGEAEAEAVVMAQLVLPAQWDTLVLLVLPVLKAQSGLPVLPARLALLALKDLLVYFPEISQATCHLMGLHCLMAMLVLIVMPALQGWEHLILM
jgi:hypothetical protein